MKYKYVIFDFDGTIIDSWLGIAKGFIKSLGEHGTKLTLDEAKDLVGPPFAKMVREKFKYDEEEAMDIILTHRKYVREEGIYEAKLYDDVINMLEALKENGIKMAIATNKPEENVEPQLDIFKIRKYFDVVISNNRLQTKGTKSDFVRMALEGMGVKNKGEAVMVGDRTGDIIGGKDNDLDTIGVTYGYGVKGEFDDIDVDYIVDSPMGIVDVVL